MKDVNTILEDEVNAIIAESVYGWKREVNGNNGREYIVKPDGTRHETMGARQFDPVDLYKFANVPKYATDLLLAWDLVERFSLSIDTCGFGMGGKPAGYWAGTHRDGLSMVGDMKNETSAFGETAALAICRAAIRAARREREALG